jgi:hypothetical protein
VDDLTYCHARGWTDGLPVIPPSRARVAAMIGARPWDDVVAVLPPAGGIATRQRIAANAVMAGCDPAYLPVVEAAVRAVADPRFNLDRVATTASSQTPMVLVGGPVAARIGVNGGRSALGSTRRPNASIGRALQLTIRNVATPEGAREHATLGQPGTYSFCFSENLLDSPWSSWHESRGMDPASSFVSVYAGEPPHCVVEMGRVDADHLLTTIAEAIAVPSTYNAFFREDLWIILSPEHARVLAGQGWSRAETAAELADRSRLPARRLRGRGLYGFLDSYVPPTWLPPDEDELVAIVDSPDRIQLVVAGGTFGGYTAIVFGEGETCTAIVDERTELV